ncbi:putative hotdog family 3-hydroxylacyl-ACP dehydratase [Oxalobacteraceae bacterium GrIS 1.11]
MTFPPIGSLLPHEGAMILLDRVLAADAENLCAEVTIRSDSLFFDGRAVGAWVGIEYMAQAIAAHAGYLARGRGEAVKVGFLLGARRYEAPCPDFILGSVLLVHVHSVMHGENGLAAFECRIEQAGAPGTSLATATVTVFQPENVNDFLLEDAHG